MSEELVLPKKCLKCGGPLDTSFKVPLRLNEPNSILKEESVAYCPRCKITYFPTKKYADIYRKSP